MATIPTPLDPAPGDKLGATTWDAQVRDLFNFLLDPPRCSAYQSGAGTTLTNGVLSGPLLYDAETEDTDSMHTTSGANSGRITFNTDGRFLVSIFVMLPNVTTYSVYIVNARLNAAGSPSGGSSIRSWDLRTPGGAPAQSAITFSKVFNSGDYIEIYVNQTSGSNRVTDFGNGQYATGIQAGWIGIS